MPTNVVMPRLGESVVEGTIVKWLKNVGDTVAKDEPLLSINTDKVDAEVPASDTGVLLQILVPEGTTVQVDTPIAVIGQPDEMVAPSANALEPKAKMSESIPEAPLAPTRPSGTGRISPVVSRMAAENSIDLSQVKGTGGGERITKQDLLTYIAAREQKATKKESVDEAVVPAWEQPGPGELFRPTEEVLKSSAPAPRPAPAHRGEDEEVMELSPMRKAIAERMWRSVQTAPHVTSVMEADLSRVVAYRESYKTESEREGSRLTYTPFFVQAGAHGLKRVPLVNSSWQEGKITLRKSIHIGIAVAVEDGLIVPVVRNADTLNLHGLSITVNDLAERARGKRLKPDEVQGSTFTITNHGVTGSLLSTPIINQPNAAILGVGAIVKRAVVIGDAIAIRPMCYLSLSFDHRILDGAVADAFLKAVKEYLENWQA